jgi:hypothetical protein
MPLTNLRKSLITPRTLAKSIALPGKGSMETMARSSFLGGGCIGATVLTMKTLSGTSSYSIPCGTNGIGSVLWNAMPSAVAWLKDSATKASSPTSGRGFSVGFTVVELKRGAEEDEGAEAGVELRGFLVAPSAALRP